MQNFGYKDLAKYYDGLNAGKDYRAESEFLIDLLDRNHAKSVLDVGCGTGSHMRLLENQGISCTGLDINQDMLFIASNKVKGNLYCTDMRKFNLGKKFDAVISMYAGFNHLLNIDDARQAINTMKNHIKSGFLLIDLYNHQSDGRKQNTSSNLTRNMEWHLDYATNIETTKTTFHVAGKVIEDEHKMRIYSIDEMIALLEEAGFKEICAFDNYTKYAANMSSKNIEIFGRLK